MIELDESIVRCSRARVYEACRLGFGSVLVAAAVLKAVALLGMSVPEPKGPRMPGILTAVMIPEFLLGLWMAGGFRPVLLHRVSVACFVAFLCFASAQAIRGAESCGCFGRAHVSPGYTMLFDFTALALLLVFAPARGHAPPPPPILRRVAWGATSIATTSLIVGAATRLSSETASTGRSWPAADGVTVLEPTEWVGRRLELLSHLAIDADVSKGFWVVVLYHHDCSKCREIVPAYERLAHRRAAKPDGPRIALLEVPPYANPGEEIVGGGSACALGRLEDSREWFVQTPAVILVRDGIVLSPDEASGMGARP